jgi:hypothetical protein
MRCLVDASGQALVTNSSFSLKLSRVKARLVDVKI